MYGSNSFHFPGKIIYIKVHSFLLFLKNLIFLVPLRREYLFMTSAPWRTLSMEVVWMF